MDVIIVDLMILTGWYWVWKGYLSIMEVIYGLVVLWSLFGLIVTTIWSIHVHMHQFLLSQLLWSIYP